MADVICQFVAIPIPQVSSILPQQVMKSVILALASAVLPSDAVRKTVGGSFAERSQEEKTPPSDLTPKRAQGGVKTPTLLLDHLFYLMLVSSY
jgi:hypothetical protein